VNRPHSEGIIGVSRPAIPFSKLIQLAGLALGQEFARARAIMHRWGPLAMLGRGKPSKLEVAPPELRPADSRIAEQIVSGAYSFGGVIVETHGESPFALQEPPLAWKAELYGFSWLRHVREADSELARANARGLVADWITRSRQMDVVAWDGGVTARRMMAWLGHAPMILDGVDQGFYDRFLRSMAGQALVLEAGHGGARPGLARLQVSIALAQYRLCVPARAAQRRKAAARLVRDLKEQILPDGGHVSRNPAVLAELMLDLLPLRQTYLATHEAPPPALMEAIERIMPMLRFFRHGDGALAQFNGAGATNPDVMTALLAYDDVRGVPVKHARYSGYHRMSAAGTAVIVDSGGPPPLRHSADAHAGVLSFELSTPLGRYVVNCGAGTRPGDQWAMPCRMTAAHSTVSIGTRSSASFATHTWLEERLGALLADGPLRVTSDREQTSEEQDLALSQDGYRTAYGVIHHRRIVLSQDGLRLDGEDWFERTSNQPDQKAEARFHLHPGVTVAMAQEGMSLLLQRTDPQGNPEHWEFVADGGKLTVEDSIFVAGPEPAQPTKQIVLSSQAAQDARLAWSFIRRSAG
jgi:uncharacterized heparinase superfamily protein